jgi:hypothetical protein
MMTIDDVIEFCRKNHEMIKDEHGYSAYVSVIDFIIDNRAALEREIAMSDDKATEDDLVVRTERDYCDTCQGSMYMETDEVYQWGEIKKVKCTTCHGTGYVERKVPGSKNLESY